ncbi:hypothetical protein [Burkholderia lata]|uniref:Uncharacterized protein n=1 Tax=Burkholderia lata (strain ATCC 17760 / DSM 23089 / LMG 22485 / NCIMB 9086 / R18194 / 383) TaxID=482957 RepID=A0A6P2T700_BURL3|nr:hypothetical protein [Burkholderia lata]VWC59144.1 hypothetical protein BLA18109_01310 [Burkholderia lata]
MPKSPALWEPYCHRADAEFHLSKFAARVLGSKAGVIFFDGQAAARLKPAVPDADGHALDLVVSTTRLPVAAADPLGNASPQTIQQLAQTWSHRVAAASGPTALDRGIATARNYMDHHKIAFGAAAVAGDMFGLLAGAVAVAAIVAGGITLLPALGLLAGFGSLLLLPEDGRMLAYQIQGDEVRASRLEHSLHYRIVEAVGPLMVMPDLLASGVRTLASLPRVAREAGAAAEEAVQATKRLVDQRKALDSLTHAKADSPDQALMREQASQMQQQTSHLATKVSEAQQKLDKARSELMLLRTIEAPAYVTSFFGTGVYGISPPDLTKEVAAWITGHRDNDSSHPAQLLVPETTAAAMAGNPSTVLQFQIGVSQVPEHAR